MSLNKALEDNTKYFVFKSVVNHLGQQQKEKKQKEFLFFFTDKIL